MILWIVCIVSVGLALGAYLRARYIGSRIERRYPGFNAEMRRH